MAFSPSPFTRLASARIGRLTSSVQVGSWGNRPNRARRVRGHKEGQERVPRFWPIGRDCLPTEVLFAPNDVRGHSHLAVLVIRRCMDGAPKLSKTVVSATQASRFHHTSISRAER